MCFARMDCMSCKNINELCKRNTINDLYYAYLYYTIRPSIPVIVKNLLSSRTVQTAQIASYYSCMK